MPKQFVNVNLTGGLNTDSNPDSVGVSLAHNFVSDPDGQGMRWREGSANFQRVAQTTDPVGGIAVVVNSRVPNLDNGDYLLTCTNTANNNEVVHLALTRPRSSVSGDSLEVRIFYSPSQYYSRFGATVTLTVRREGSLDRQVRVNYTTVNGSATSGVDYAAASGTLTFAAGEIEKTISVTTIAAAQTTDKTFTVRLSSGTAGIVFEEPRSATVTLQVLSLISSFGAYNPSNTLWPVYLYNPVAQRCTAHYLTQANPAGAGPTNYGLGNPIVKVTPNVICAGVAQTGNSHIIKIALYSMAQIFSDGAAYSAGAGNIGAAIKTAPYATLSLTGTSGNRDDQQFWIVPYTNTEFFVVNLSAIWRINVLTGAVINQFPTPTHNSSFTTWTTLSLGGSDPAPRPFFGLDGNLHVFVNQMNATNVRVLLKINPDTGALISSKAVGGVTSMSPLADGSIILTIGGTGATASALTSDLSTLTALTGTLGEARTSQIPITGATWLAYNGDSLPVTLKKFSYSGSTLSTVTSYPAGHPFAIESGDTPGIQFGLINTTSFAMRYRSSTLAVDVVGVYNLSDGNVTPGFLEVAQLDFYNGESVSGSLLSHFPLLNGFGDQPDITLFYLRQIAGLME